VIAGLVARQRRLLRGAYMLADADMRLEAGMLVRAMLEYLILQKWLELEPRLHHVLWVKDDLEGRLRIDMELRQQAPGEHEEALELMEPDRRAEYESSLEEMREQVAQAQEELRLDKAPRYPSVKQQAEATGLAFVYSLAYRYESQSGVHPTAMAIETLIGQPCL
jgi:hypothetical protein